MPWKINSHADRGNNTNIDINKRGTGSNISKSININNKSSIDSNNSSSNSSSSSCCSMEENQMDPINYSYDLHQQFTRFPDGAVRLRNPHIAKMDQDILYHLALGSGSHDLRDMFGDVKFVCMGGTPKRMEEFAYYILDEIGHKLQHGTKLLDISLMSHRYSMFKVGPVLCVSHGMGIPSVGILLHEVIKLMYHAGCQDPVFFRLGTCGGIGIEGGNIVVSESAVDGMLQPYLELPVLGKLQRRPALLDKRLAAELKTLGRPGDPYSIHLGKTMCTYDFYEGQGRLDGAFCEYSESDKLAFLHSIHAAGVINMEMESLCFAALCHHAGIRSAVVCVTLLNRLNGDQVISSKETLNEWQSYPQQVVGRYIKQTLGLPVNVAQRSLPQQVTNAEKIKMVRQQSATFDLENRTSRDKSPASTRNTRLNKSANRQSVSPTCRATSSAWPPPQACSPSPRRSCTRCW